jgi:cytochrome c oxidase subunit 1
MDYRELLLLRAARETGVLNALVFTTFFISGLILYLPARELNVSPNIPFMWTAYGVMLGGLVMAGVAILANTSNVLYTFYPPLYGHWGFYIGLAPHSAVHDRDLKGITRLVV